LAELKSQRMEVLTNMESQSRLQYELKKSLAAEDYKQSALIRDKIAAKNLKS
jgi:protein-arginine kinase activator protein McsA